MTQVKIGGYWFRLAQNKDGTPMYRPSPLPFFPPQFLASDANEAAFSPSARASITMRDLSGGFGQAEMPILRENIRYDRIMDTDGGAGGVDASLMPEGPVILGPGINVITGGAQITPAPSGRLFGIHAPTAGSAAYIALGRYVYSWTDTFVFTNVGDLGAGASATDGITAFRGTYSSDHWYLPLGYADTPQYSTDSGANWADITTTGGLDNVRSMAVVDGRIYVAMKSPISGNARIAQFEDGGPNPTLFGVIDPVGQAGQQIDRLMAFNSRVVIFKDTEGIFLLAADRNLLQQNILGEMGTLFGRIYSLGAAVWRGILWVPTNRGLYAISPDSWTLRGVGPEQSGIANSSGINGVVTAVTGDAHNLYAFLYSSSTTTSWLLKANVTTSGGQVTDIAWHPIARLDSGAQCQRMEVANPVGPMLIVDYLTTGGANKLYTANLPGRGRDPRADPNYRYSISAELFLSRITARFPHIPKQWLSITPHCADLGRRQDGITAYTHHGIITAYKTDDTPLTASTPWGYTLNPVQTSGVGTRSDLSGVRATGLDVFVRFSTADGGSTPQLQSVTVDYVNQPSVVWAHEMTIEVSSGALADDGSGGYGDPMTPQAAYHVLRTLPGSAAFSFTAPLGNPPDEHTVVCPPDGVKPTPIGPGEQGYGGDIPLRFDITLIETTPASEAIR